MEEKDIRSTPSDSNSNFDHIKLAATFNVLIVFDSSSSILSLAEYSEQAVYTKNSNIHLFYLKSLDHLPESINALRISEWVNESHKEARQSIEVVKFLFEQRGLHVFSTDYAVGNRPSLLQTKVESVQPDLILVGQNNFDSAISKLAKRLPCALLLVPMLKIQKTLSTEESSTNKNLVSAFVELEKIALEFN
jgi:hypothetical protein